MTGLGGNEYLQKRPSTDGAAMSDCMVPDVLKFCGSPQRISTGQVDRARLAAARSMIRMREPQAALEVTQLEADCISREFVHGAGQIHSMASGKAGQEGSHG